MDTAAEIERLRLEADTIMTRYEEVQRRLEEARQREGEQWETGELTVTLDSPHGEEISLTLDFESDPSDNAQRRYERATELEADLERRARIADQLRPLPADPLAYLICYHLDHVEGNYPKSMAGHLDAERGHVEDLCKEMVETGVLERVESGTVKQRRVKAKKTDEVRQHHTYYRLSREGDHLLRFLAEREGRVNVLRHLPDGNRLLERLRDGPESPRQTAEKWDQEFEYIRHVYRALRQVGLLTESERTDTATERQHTAYAVTEQALSLQNELQ
jgi:predicted transcriptional regulator